MVVPGTQRPNVSLWHLEKNPPWSGYRVVL
jgi:hypothetical protein